MPTSQSSKAAVKLAEASKRKPGRPRMADQVGTPDPRERLLKVAIRLFAQRGFEAVSTGDVAKAAKLSQPMVHYHFGSKDHLWRAAIDHLMSDLALRFPSNSNDLKDLDPVSQLKVMTRRFITMSASDSSLSRIVIHESLSRSERLDWLVGRYVKRGFDNFDNVIKAGIRAGLIKDLPLYAATNTLISAASFTFCVSAMVRLVYEADLTEPDTISEMADSIIAILFNGLIVRVQAQSDPVGHDEAGDKS